MRTSLQKRINEWIVACFGTTIATDKTERTFRFCEEALELCQSRGLSKDDAIRLVEYVYERPVGEEEKEIGGVVVAKMDPVDHEMTVSPPC